MDQNKLLIYMHIPKTAGTSVKWVLDGVYPRNSILYYYEDPELFKLSAPNNIKLIYGHLMFKKPSHFSRPLTYITMLRNPIELVVSLYFYIQREPSHPLHKEVTKMSFEQFIDHETYSCPNIQTYYVSGEVNPNLSKAKENIKKYFSVVGITEKFDESIFLMKKELGWNNFNYQNMFKKTNVTKNRLQASEIPQKIIDKIKKKNHLDFELYKWAEQNLNEQFRNLDNASKQEFRNFLTKINKFRK
ncbi:sulfotransferase family 2 domain-containing protein [Metabacillus sp. Hm71]|uniref:sulfotransferase family 2 domain-containing protein n=1 Tax=Metabacillus sp. Hm71 TaxID=3450743 RepID=UPI003F4293AE